MHRLGFLLVSLEEAVILAAGEAKVTIKAKSQMSVDVSHMMGTSLPSHVAG